MLESKDIECVNIGDQHWTTKNLDIDHFRNGDLISESKTYQEWINSDLYEEPAWCYYDFDPNNGKKFGKLYNFHAIQYLVDYPLKTFLFLLWMIFPNL
jgi:hypothetical protein